jgi:hypothetical protein
MNLNINPEEIPYIGAPLDNRAVEVKINQVFEDTLESLRVQDKLKGSRPESKPERNPERILFL